MYLNNISGNCIERSDQPNQRRSIESQMSWVQGAQIKRKTIKLSMPLQTILKYQFIANMLHGSQLHISKHIIGVTFWHTFRLHEKHCDFSFSLQY